MNLFKNKDLKHDLECQIKENAKKQDEIHNLKVEINVLKARIDNYKNNNNELSVMYKQLKEDYDKLLKAIGGNDNGE